MTDIGHHVFENETPPARHNFPASIAGCRVRPYAGWYGLEPERSLALNATSEGTSGTNQDCAALAGAERSDPIGREGLRGILVSLSRR